MPKVTHQARTPNLRNLFGFPGDERKTCLDVVRANIRTTTRFLVILATILSLGCMNVTTQRDIVREDSSEANRSGSGNTYGIGTEANVGSLALTMNNVRISDGRNLGVRVPFPRDGNIYLLVDVTLKNAGDEFESVSSRMQINLIDANGRTQEWGLFPATQGSIDGMLYPGQEREGELVWEVAEDAAGLKMVFDETVFTIGDVTNYWEGEADGLLSSRN